MVPVKREGSLVREFMLVSSPMLCCFGMMPRVNEWVTVRMVAKGLAPVQEVPLTLYGTLRVGETCENGFLVGLDQLDGERLAVK